MVQVQPYGLSHGEQRKTPHQRAEDQGEMCAQECPKKRTWQIR